MPLAQLVYVSRAAESVDDDALAELLAACADKNRALEVTGVLIYGAGHFIQAIEGDDRRITELFVKICADRRHADVRLLAHRFVDKRVFDAWSMGRLDPEATTELDIERLFLKARLLGAPDREGDREERVAALLREFRRQLAPPDQTSRAA